MSEIITRTDPSTIQHDYSDAPGISMNTLPNELLDRILGHLGLADKLQAECVCQRWALLLAPLYLKHRSLRVNCGQALIHYDGCSDRGHTGDRTGVFAYEGDGRARWPPAPTVHLTKSMVQSLGQRCPQLVSIHLENCWLDVRALIALLAACPHLQCLSLIEIGGISGEDEWRAVGRQLAAGGQLKHLALSDCQSVPLRCLRPAIGGLQELTLLYHWRWSVCETLRALGPGIRRVTVKYCEESNADIVVALAASAGTHSLTHLTIHDPFIRDEVQTLDAVCALLPRLERCTIGFGDITGPYRPIATLRANSKFLDLTLDQLRWQTMKAFYLPDVEYLTLDVTFAGHRLAPYLAAVFPNLRHLYVSHRCDCDLSDEFCDTNHKCRCFDQIMDTVAILDAMVYVSVNGQYYHIRADGVYRCRWSDGQVCHP